MEPCTLWGKFLLGEREGHAFFGPQVRACREQQPGTLSGKKALQPLLTTGLEEEAVFQYGIQMASASWLPFEEVAFTEDMMFSATWSAQNRASQEQKWTFTQILQNEQEITAFAEAIEDECGSPPTLPCRHQRCSGHHHHLFDQVAGQYAANETIARPQLGEHHCRCS